MRILDGQAAAQGDRRARPAGEPGRMRRALAFSPCGCWRSPAAACGRFMRAAEPGRSRRRCAASQVAPIPGRAGWLVRTALEDRLGNGERRPPRYRLEVELDDDITGFGIRSRQCGDARAADAARALPAGRRRARHGAARRHRRLGRRHRRRLAPNMPPSPPSRPRSSGCRSRSPTRSSRASPSTPRAAARRRSEGEPGADRARR